MRKPKIIQIRGEFEVIFRITLYREKWVKLRGILFFSDQNEEWNI